MNIYLKLYYTIISRGVNKKDLWENKSNQLHRHHIVPKHSGGLDEESNYSYLTIREHIAAHFLLWKIHKNPNDLRSMHMLGAKLSRKQRQIIGRWCYENKIGMFSASSQQKNEWSKKGVTNQIVNGIGIHNPDNFSYHASLGGKAAIKSPNNPWSYWASPEGRSERARMGGKALNGYKCVHKPGDKTFKRIKPENVEEYLSKGYILGSPLSPRRGKTGPFNRRKKVCDGHTIFASLKMAAEAYGITSSSICLRCKSDKYPNWTYV